MRRRLPSVTVIVPVYNGASVISDLLQALRRQAFTHLVGLKWEVLVVDDGSQDETAAIVRKAARSKAYPLRLLSQANSGPAAARNHGARKARSEIIVFTDADCRPHPDWLEQMVLPFVADSSVGGVKGAYSCTQPQLTARFVQYEYEYKYRRMASHPRIDFIDTYAAAFRRSLFTEHGGYNTGFPVACAEDVEFSFRLKQAGVIMLFNPQALVGHVHPHTMGAYFRKKYKFAYWRTAALRLHPGFAVQDSHTPQTMKLQVLLLGAFFLLAPAALLFPGQVLLPWLWAGSLAGYLAACVPFYRFLVQRDRGMLLAAWPRLLLRSLGQGLGVGMRLLDSLLGRKRIGTGD